MPFNLLTISMKKILYTFLVLTILGTGPVHAQNGSDPGLGEPVELDEIVVTADRDPVPSDGDTLLRHRLWSHHRPGFLPTHSRAHACL